jgi:hypothetical protein
MEFSRQALGRAGKKVPASLMIYWCDRKVYLH